MSRAPDDLMVPDGGELKTARLSLNLVSERDRSFMFKLVNTEGWLKFIGNRNVSTEQEAIVYIRKILNTLNLTYWVVRITSTQEPIGIISFIKREYLEHHDIGFAFLPEFGGQGYAFEAAHAMLSRIRKMPAHTTVLATTIPENESSISLLKKLGFLFEKEINVGSGTLHVYSTK
jgi:ribosomal-protein-alanine N-acetyltransferase